MSASQAIAPYLPFLRRYARALTGSQASGDAYVAAALEALIEDTSVLDTASSPRVALYHLFSKIWNSVVVNGKSGADDATLPGRAAHQPDNTETPSGLPSGRAGRISRKPMPPTILDVDIPTLRQLVEESGRELAAEIATDALIIEDEPFIAMDLEGLVESLGHRVLGIARTHTEAMTLAKAKRPGLILADIQLADGSSGLDAVNELLRSFEVPVIFITAYPERFLTGERPEPAFLIAKPFQPATVSAVISQALFFERNARRSERARGRLIHDTKFRRMVLRRPDHFRPSLLCSGGLARAHRKAEAQGFQHHRDLLLAGHGIGFCLDALDRAAALQQARCEDSRQLAITARSSAMISACSDRPGQ